VKRREFMAMLGGAAATWPLAARAQQPAVPVVGFLHSGTSEGNANVVAGFRKGLNEAGYIEGRNVTVEFRWAQNESKRLPELAAELASRRVAVIATPGNAPAALAAKAATATIPVVFSTGADPIQAGLVTSLNRPGGNVTGISSMNLELVAKRVGLLRELLPKAVRLGVLLNSGPFHTAMLLEARESAAGVGLQIEALTIGTVRDIEAAIGAAVQKQADALLISPGAPLIERRVQIATLAARHALPTVFHSREGVELGGLMSYGPSIADEFRQVGLLVARVIKGEKPADMPILRPTKFEFVINLQTARALNIAVPATLLAQADEVIE
jgi:putative ABC transport system substrate-binding protein